LPVIATSPQQALRFLEKPTLLSNWRGDEESSTFRRIVGVRLAVKKNDCFYN